MFLNNIFITKRLHKMQTLATTQGLDFLASCAIIDSNIEKVKERKDPFTLTSLIEFSYAAEIKYKKSASQNNLLIQNLRRMNNKLSSTNTKLFMENELLKVENEQLKLKNEAFIDSIRELKLQIIQLRFQIHTLQHWGVLVIQPLELGLLLLVDKTTQHLE